MLNSEPWFIELHAANDLMQRIEAAQRMKLPTLTPRSDSRRQDIDLIHITGPLVRRGSWLGELLGLQSYDALRASILRAGGDESVAAVVLFIDSPGGIASGCLEVARTIRQVAQTKPVIACCDGMATSAAYFLASSATYIVASADSLIGSVGTVIELKNASKMLERIGVQTHLFTTGDFKQAGHPGVPMSGAAQVYFQDLTDDINRHFAEHVERHRQLKGDAKSEVFSAKVFIAERAMELGLIDAIAFPSEVVESLAQRSRVHQAAGLDSEFGYLCRSLPASASNTFWDAVAVHESKGMDRHESIKLVNRQQPELRRAMLAKTSQPAAH